MDYRSRIIALYTCYAPEKVADVDARLAKYEGREEEFIQAIVSKYGPEPAFAERNTEGEHTVQEWEEDEWNAYYRQRLVNFYTVYAPEKIDSVDNQLTKYAGREELFFEALVAKYGPEPECDNADENESKVTDNDNLGYRERLVALYTLYAPSKLANVDAQLEKYRGQEEAFIAALVNKYGPEPSVAAESTASDYRSRVVSIYERYAPSKLANVDAQLEKYRGQEEAFIAALEQKYGPEPSVAAESTASDYRSRVVSIYERYAPSKLANVDAQLEKYRGQEEAFIAALEQKYGPEPSVAAESTASDYRSRVVSIYERYAPSKLANVDAQLEKYRGQEEAFIAALVSRYGPEPSVAAESTASDYRSRVVSIYERYAPSKLANVDAQLEKYRGQEEALIAALEQKYVHGMGSAVPSSSVSGRVSPSKYSAGGSFRERLVALYTLYAPNKLANVDAQLEKYRGQEEAFIAALVSRYGPEPSVAAESTASDYRSRVVSIYERYAPSKLANVDAQLEKYRGQEEALIAALEQKYVHGMGSAVPSSSVSGRVSPSKCSAGGSFRERLVALYTLYAPSKLANVDAQLEKYRGQEEALIAALEQKYVHGMGSAVPSSSVSGRMSPMGSGTAESSPQLALMEGALTIILEEEGAGRLELLGVFTAGLINFCVHAESERRFEVEYREHLAAVVFEEFSIRLSILADEAISRPLLVHPPFPFVSGDSAELVARFFASLGTTDVNGKAFIVLSACRLLFFEAVGVELLEEPTGELVSLGDFRQLLTRACHGERDVLARMQSFILNARRRERPMCLTASQELRVGFWAYRCVKPCVVEDWQRVWVVLEDDARLVIRRPNLTKPELTIPVGHVIKCQLASMLGTRAPRSCAKNGLYMQLSTGVNPVLLLLCPQRVVHAHALVKMFRLGAQKEPPAVAKDAAAEGRESLRHKGEDKFSSSAAVAGGGGDEICRPEDVFRATTLWCCRGGCSKFVRSVWILAGDFIVHHTEGEKKKFTWNLATVKDVYLVNELAMRPPVAAAKHAFVVVHERGSLFCCTETAAARDALVGYMKRVIFKHFLQSNQAHSSALTSFVTEENRDGDGAAVLAGATHRVPGAA